MALDTSMTFGELQVGDLLIRTFVDDRPVDAFLVLKLPKALIERRQGRCAACDSWPISAWKFHVLYWCRLNNVTAEHREIYWNFDNVIARIGLQVLHRDVPIP